MTSFVNKQILFLGTPEFAIPALEQLIEKGYLIVGVVTNPDELAGRKQILTAPPIKKIAQRHHIPVYQPSTLNIEYWSNEIPEADLYIVASYGKIIPKAILDIPPRGVLNIHPSLLPRWRGSSPIQYTILHGDKDAGVSIILLDELMDHGPILAQRHIDIDTANVTYAFLHERLANEGATLLIEILPQYIDGAITPQLQDDAKATFSKILKKSDGRINWSKPAIAIDRMIRAFNPWPGTWTLWPTSKKIYRLRIEAASVIDDEPAEGSPGYIWQNDAHPLIVKTGKEGLAIQSLTLEGKKTLPVEEFLRGYREIIGSVLI